MLGGGAAPEGNHLFIGLHHPPGADTTRFKRDANFQCWNACSTCHDGLLAVVTSASQGAVLSGAVPPETRHHSQVVVVSVEYSSRTLPRCWQLCRKCKVPLSCNVFSWLGGHLLPGMTAPLSVPFCNRLPEPIRPSISGASSSPLLPDVSASSM